MCIRHNIGPVCIRSVCGSVGIRDNYVKSFCLRVPNNNTSLHQNNMTSIPDHLVPSVHVNPEKFIISLRHKTCYI